MSATVLAWQNYVSTATLTAGSAAAGLSVQNLQDDRGSPSVGWQTVSGVITAAGGATLTVTPAAPAQTWRAFGLFRTNLTAAASVTFALSKDGSVVWSASADGPLAGYQQAVVIASTDQTADSLTVSIDDPGNPDGFINVPLAFAGPVWFPATGASWSSTVGRDDDVSETVSRGGQEYPVLLWQRRRWALALDGVRATELWTDIGELDRISRAGGNVLFAPDAGSADLQREAVFGRLASTADVTFPYQGADRRAWKANITERL